jgi:hypothetical protein
MNPEVEQQVNSTTLLVDTGRRPEQDLPGAGAMKARGGVMDAARYLYVCPVHGHCASALIRQDKMPPAERCPKCAQPTEVWVGAADSATKDGGRVEVRAA